MSMIDNIIPVSIALALGLPEGPDFFAYFVEKQWFLQIVFAKDRQK